MQILRYFDCFDWETTPEVWTFPDPLFPEHDEAWAKARHEAKEPYCVHIENDDDVIILRVLQTEQWCDVSFLNEWDAPYMAYSFTQNNDALELAEAYHYFYDEETKAYQGHEYFVFGDDSCTMLTFEAESVTSSEFEYDPSLNREDIPIFGRWEAVCRSQR